MATLILENGVDARMIQAILGHAKLTTTGIYTLPAIAKLEEIHSPPTRRPGCGRLDLSDETGLIENNL